MEAVVTFDYDAQQDDELTLKVGQVLKNVRKVDEGWAEGELLGKKGMFPDNFVEMRKATPEDHPPPPVAKEERAPVNNLAQPQKAKRLLRATFEYGAINEDELTLKVGDIVEFLADEEEGWYKGQLRGKIGVFPSNFVEEAPPSAAPSGVTSTDGKQPHSVPVADRPSKPPPPIPNEGGAAANHHADTAPSAARGPSTFGGKQVLPMGELPLKPSDLKKRPPPHPTVSEKPEKPSQAPPTTVKPKKEAPPPPSKRDRPPVMPKAPSKQDLATPDRPTDHTSGENDFEGLPEHRLLDHVQRSKGPPRKPPSQSRLAEGKSPEPDEETSAAKSQPTWSRRSVNTPAKPSEPPARPASVIRQGGHPKIEPKPSPPPPAGTSAAQSNAELVSLVEALKLDFKKLRDEYRHDIDTLMADLDQERKKVRALEIDIDRLKKRSTREN